MIRAVIKALEGRVSFCGTTNARLAPPWPPHMKLFNFGQAGRSEVAESGFWREIKRYSARLVGTCDCQQTQERVDGLRINGLLDQIQEQLQVQAVLSDQLDQLVTQQRTAHRAAQGSQGDPRFISRMERLTEENRELITVIKKFNKERTVYTDKIASLQPPREELLPNVAAKVCITFIHSSCLHRIDEVY